ncbi:TetR/AcrR family transcriptional regulator [Actinoplanes sp. CA-131856]
MRSETTRRAILDATRAELTAHGYDKLSIDRIAAAAGSGKQTVYRWYPSKSSLIADCLIEGDVLDGPSIPDSGDVRTDLRSWLHAFAGQFDRGDSAAFIRAATAAAAESDEVAVRFYEAITAGAEAELTARLVAAAEAGQLRRGAVPGTLAQALIGALLYRLLTRQPFSVSFRDDLVVTLCG